MGPPDVPPGAPQPSPSSETNVNRMYEYLKKCEVAGGATVIKLDDEDHTIELVCVTPALRRIRVEPKEEK